MAKAIGLHRIINNISKSKENQFRKKINDQNAPAILSSNDNTSSTPVKQTTCENRESKKLKVEHNIPGKNQTKKAPPILSLTLCKGITCNKNNSRWCLDQNFNANKIEKHRKHCVRCSKFCTAMKQGAEQLDEIQEINSQKDIKILHHEFKTATTNGINYASMMHSLEKCQRHSESSTEAKYIKKIKFLIDTN